MRGFRARTLLYCLRFSSAFMTVSMGFTDSHEQAKNLAVRRKKNTDLKNILTTIVKVSRFLFKPCLCLVVIHFSFGMV